jgi:hypothetical protein
MYLLVDQRAPPPPPSLGSPAIFEMMHKAWAHISQTCPGAVHSYR